MLKLSQMLELSQAEAPSFVTFHLCDGVSHFFLVSLGIPTIWMKTPPGMHPELQNMPFSKLLALAPDPKGIFVVCVCN